MVIKKKAILFSFSSIIILLAMVIAPWGVGQFLHSALVKQVDKFNKNYPDFEYKIQSYQVGIFGSSMVTTLTLKNTLDPKTPIFKILTEEKIAHGPIFFDFQNKDIQFCLAKISSQMKPEKGTAIQFGQDVFSFNSIVNYNGKIKSSLCLDKVSGAVNLFNKAFRFEFNNLHSKMSLNLNSVYPSYHLSIKEAHFYSESIQTAVNIKDISIDNISKSNQDVSGSNRFAFGLLEGIVSGKKYLLEDYALATETEAISNKYYFKFSHQLKKIVLNNLIYGPLQASMLINKLPVQFVQDIQAIEVSDIDKNEKDKKISNLVLNSELDLEFILKTLTLQMPGGELSLNGRGNFISKLNQNKMDYKNSDAKYTLNVSKQALDNLLYAIVKPGDNIESILDMMLSSGYLVDTGKNYESYFIYRNGKSYVNGFAYLDMTSRDFPKQLIRPFTPTQELMISVWLDDIEKAKATLLHQDVNINVSNPDVKNPIHTAALMGNLNIVRLLLEHKVPVDQPDYRGSTALYWAARSGYFDIVQELLKHGAYPNVQNMNGWTPLQEAAENGHKEIVKILLEQKNIEVNQTDREGRTALFWAARNGQNEIIRMLLNKGADRNIANIRGLKAVDIARQENHLATVNLLEDWVDGNNNK